EAILLLNKADIFIRKRLLDYISNSLITIFLRMLKYYKEIIFLTTNYINEFNNII
ncbi:uncharacterized protein K441DRAFT_577099, partial [Cenococcum geophilum 1.58]|uniref:uncharacterized protein n=1 Tax=Cenococcum geophilum 1.58 TaxID=794803 RepID=UPI00358DF63C